MDLTYLAIDSTQFPICDWSEFYGEVEEPLPPNVPKANGSVHVHQVTIREINVHIYPIVDSYIPQYCIS